MRRAKSDGGEILLAMLAIFLVALAIFNHFKP